MKHSPGKWVAECVGQSDAGESPVEVWEVTNGHARIAEYLTEADARLTAAAPELLDALRRLTHPMADDSDLDHALAVIAMAEGRG